MKRRIFGLTSVSTLALLAAKKNAFAQSAAPDASLLTTTLTPVGAERAGNAAGTIPAWTGGLTQTPAGMSWDPTKTLPPDFFADDKMLYEVNASNMAQYADLLTEGVQNLIQKGFSLQVFPTHRTAAMPQWVYDNVALNATRATPNPGGVRLGWKGAYGGTPFPIPDTSDPYTAGAQIIWNHETRWTGSFFEQMSVGFVITGGDVTLTNGANVHWEFPYYAQGADPSAYDGYYWKVLNLNFSPSNIAGQETLNFQATDPFDNPAISWELLQGQGRVRKTPEVKYDTPNNFADGIIDDDEFFGFAGAMDRYDWKFLGKREMLIPYNNNKTFTFTSTQSVGPKFYNPDAVRWELHRVWVVEATVHPGDRNVLGRRKLYVDEDTWFAMIVDAWDNSGDMVRCTTNFVANFPNLPGTIAANCILYDLQTGDYVADLGSYSDAPYNTRWTFDPVSPSTFEPQAMAASAAY